MSALRRGLLVDDPLAAGSDRSPQTAGEGMGRLREIPIREIRANPAQPRKRFDEPALAALADSIRERGVLQPVIAVDDAGSLELALIENIVREDLSPVEQARTIAVLLDDLRMTASVLSRRIGRSRADIANTVRLLDLPDDAIDLIDTGALSKGHGKALLTEADHHRRLLLARQAVEKGWSVRALEHEIAKTATPSSKRSAPSADQCAVASRLEEAITRAIGCEATTKPHKDGFQIVLDHQAADRLLRALGTELGAL